MIPNQFIQIDDHQAFASTQLSLVSFKGLSNIHCGSEVFPSNIKDELPPNYQQIEFCGIKVEKPDFISSDPELVITSDQEPDLETSSDQEISLMSSSNQNPDSVSSLKQEPTQEIESNPNKKSSKKLSKSTIAVIVVSCFFAVAVIVFVVIIVIQIYQSMKRINSNSNISEHELSIAQ